MSERKQLHLPYELKKEIELLAVQHDYPRANDLYIELLELGLSKYKEMKSMNTFFDGQPITTETLMVLIETHNEEPNDLHHASHRIFNKMLDDGYKDVEEDIEYIVDKLNVKTRLGWLYKDANLLDVEDIIRDGEWNFGKFEDFEEEDGE